ncbi:MAG: hypothetical protein ABSE99_01370 [Terracidiphilus sp.]|jgi:hypothetical protein
MAEVSPYVLSRCFSQLTGRKVAFVQTKFSLDMKIRQIYGIYALPPNDMAIIVKADLQLMGSIAGALVGLPDAAVKEHLKVSPIEELMRDAISEVFNIAATVISTEGRAVFTKMVTDPAYIEGPAAKVYKEPFHRSYFTVTVEGYQGGRFAVLAPFVPIRLVAH